MKKLAPVAFFGYNRPGHTRQTLEALMQSRLSEQTELYIFIDGPRPGADKEAIEQNNEVKNVVREKPWCKEVKIFEAETNKGLFHSIVDGINLVLSTHPTVIVLEDDVRVFPGFLTFMNNALDLYEKEDRVMHISGFSKPQFENVPIKETSYFFNHTTCWGWATWKRAWAKFNPDPLQLMKLARQKGNLKKLNINGTFEHFWSLHSIAHKKFQSWNTLWHTCVFLNDGLCLHPAKSLTANFGFDGSGTNCDVNEQVGNNPFYSDDLPVYPIPLENHPAISKYNTYKMHSFRFRTVFFIKHKLRFLFRR